MILTKNIPVKKRLIGCFYFKIKSNTIIFEINTLIMKNFLLVLLLISFNQLYAQNESFTLKYNDILNSKNTNSNIFGADYQTNLDEIINFESIFIENNSEGKFLKYSLNEASSILIENVEIKSAPLSVIEEKSVVVILKNDFVKKLTQKFTLKEKVKKNDSKEYFKYDKEIIADKFNKAIYEKDFTIQVGKNICEYINKLYKSDIDKTFVNELNLLVVNF